MRIGAAAAPRWWGVDREALPAYLAHLTTVGASSVEFIVHHGPATRDPASVHLDRADWDLAIDLAADLGLHVDLHNSLDPRLRLARWSTDPKGLQTDLASILDLLSTVEGRQSDPPCLVVHAADGCPNPESVTFEFLGWATEQLERRGSTAVICLELRAGEGPHDDRFDRDRQRLADFIEELGTPSVGLCWDVANEWMTVVRAGGSTAFPETPPARVRHVHLHDATVAGMLHAPLGSGRVPWQAALDALRREEWAGSATLEIRYRLANDDGDPWTVLAESVRRAKSVR